MRLLFGLLLALFVTVPALRDAALGVLVSPPVLAFGAGVLAWPRITAAAKRWAR
jgi:hypothetical protein